MKLKSYKATKITWNSTTVKPDSLANYSRRTMEGKRHKNLLERNFCIHKKFRKKKNDKNVGRNSEKERQSASNTNSTLTPTFSGSEKQAIAKKTENQDFVDKDSLYFFFFDLQEGKIQGAAITFTEICRKLENLRDTWQTLSTLMELGVISSAENVVKETVQWKKRLRSPHRSQPPHSLTPSPPHPHIPIPSQSQCNISDSKVLKLTGFCPPL